MDIKTIIDSLTPPQIPFLMDPEHEAQDLRPWSELFDKGLVENRNHPQGPSRTELGEAVFAHVQKVATQELTAYGRLFVKWVYHGGPDDDPGLRGDVLRQAIAESLGAGLLDPQNIETPLGLAVAQLLCSES